MLQCGVSELLTGKFDMVGKLVDRTVQKEM